MHLLTKQEDIMFDAGDLLYRNGPYKPGLWWLDDPEVPFDLVRVAEQNVLPTLRSVQSLQDYLDIALPKDPAELKFCWGLRFVFAMALGDLDAARGFLEEDKNSVYARRLNAFREGLGDRLLEQGANLSTEDRKLLAAYLCESEEYTVDKLKIRHVWERRPFPIEMRSDGHQAIS